MHTPHRVAFESFLTGNAALAERMEWAKALARSDVRILIEGETGTGKSRLARQVLAQENGNVSAAARALGLARCTLIEWLKEDAS